MRFNAIPLACPKDGAIRKRVGFLWLPKTAISPRTGKLQCRWLEKASWHEQYHPEPIYKDRPAWVPTIWENEVAL